MKKYLVYYTHGYSNKYLDLLKLSIETLRKNSNTDLFDIMIMCDIQYINYCNEINDVIILPMKNSDSPHEASMHKINIFEYNYIHNYNAVLFIDSDILVNMNVIDLLDNCISNDKLYVCTERYDVNDHNHIFWSLRDYNEYDINFFRENNIYVFNAGCFLFVPSNEMEMHFNNIINMIKNNTKEFFYEQSFMNVYFNKNNNTDRNLLTNNNYILFPEQNINYGNKLIHFCGTHQSVEQKLQLMKIYINLTEIELFDTRDEMINSLINKHGNCAEIGVFKGDFSKKIIDLLKPSNLLLIDLFRGFQISGDHDGNNVIHTNLDEEYYNLCDLYKNNNQVSILKGDSVEILFNCPDMFFDMIYIDGDHSYEGCKKDLEISYKKVKKGGYICGHDYEMNMKKTNNYYEFGVKRAVDEFCEKYNLKITAKGLDGCVSYAIKL